ncbi:hypothetical protein ACFX14_006149 [Malus domestica]
MKTQFKATRKCSTPRPSSKRKTPLPPAAPYVLRLLPDCRHLFHLMCVDPWLRLNPTCPVCRTSPIPTPLSTPLAKVVPLPSRWKEIGAYQREREWWSSVKFLREEDEGDN